MRRTLIILSIVLVILLGAGAYFFVRSGTPAAPSASDVTAVTTADHILGNPAAPIILVEYCDIDSPYCKNFQTVMESVIATYGKDGTVAWVYRHLPLTDQYPDAVNVARASECAAAKGGTDAFFKFIDAADAAAPGSASLDSGSYPGIVERLGIDADAFASCASGSTYDARITADAQNALAAGATGAPYTIILIHGQPAVPLSGAFSYDQMKQLIDAVLAKLPA